MDILFGFVLDNTIAKFFDRIFEEIDKHFGFKHNFKYLNKQVFSIDSCFVEMKIIYRSLPGLKF